MDGWAAGLLCWLFCAGPGLAWLAWWRRWSLARAPQTPLLPIPVSRIRAKSDLFEMDMLLDVNTDIYPLAVGDKLSFLLASTLSLDGTPHPPTYDAVRAGSRRTLADDYDYVCHGRVFKVKDAAGGGAGVRAQVYASFGGLLMQLTAEPERVTDLDVDEDIFLLMNKIKA